jgi:hypothetical protein
MAARTAAPISIIISEERAYLVFENGIIDETYPLSRGIGAERHIVKGGCPAIMVLAGVDCSQTLFRRPPAESGTIRSK